MENVANQSFLIDHRPCYGFLLEYYYLLYLRIWLTVIEINSKVNLCKLNLIRRRTTTKVSSKRFVGEVIPETLYKLNPLVTQFSLFTNIVLI